MAYEQKFGLSRSRSPLNNEEKSISKPTLIDVNNQKAKKQVVPTLKPSGSNPHMLSQGTEDDSWWTKLKTGLSNPLDAFKVAGGFGQDQFKGEGHTYRSMTSLRKAKDAQAKGVKVPDLENSNAMNNVLSLAPPMMVAQTLADAASGDLMGAFAGKFTKKFKTIKKPAQSLVKKVYAGIKYKNAIGKTI